MHPRPCRWMIVAIALVMLGQPIAAMATGTSPTESVIYSFRGSSDGATPAAALLADRTGALYGTTANGGHGLGTVFMLEPSHTGYSESILYRFQGGSDGSHPYSTLITDASGALYGTTRKGGTYHEGTAFKLTRSASGYSETVIHAFGAKGDGIQPIAGLVRDDAGNLYGTAWSGRRGGAVFQLTPTGSGYTETIAYQFAEPSEGEDLVGGVIRTPNGTIFGSSAEGGTDNDGSIFALSPSASGYHETFEYPLSLETGTNSWSAPILDGAGNLYTTTIANGGCIRQCYSGTVIKLTPSASTYTESTIHVFRGGHGGADGAIPEAPLLLENAGVLYGTTSAGGRGGPRCPSSGYPTGCGTVFRLTPSGDGYTEAILYAFRWGADGAFPQGGLIANSGALFGTTNFGGTVDQGTVFRIAL
jgi:uncharacterized repeat protein (TIGR03803 family)